MEIEVSKIITNQNIFTENKLCGYYEENGNLLKKLFPKRKRISVISFLTVSQFIYFENKKHPQLIRELLDNYDDIKNCKLNTLSDSVLLKLLIIKGMCSRNNYVILNHIDSFLTKRDLVNLLKELKNTCGTLKKTVVFASNIADNLIPNCNHFVVVIDNNVVYTGKDITYFAGKSDLIDLVDLAKKRKAKLNYYKDSSDLLKAIYRSVEK